MLPASDPLIVDEARAPPAANQSVNVTPRGHLQISLRQSSRGENPG